MDWTTQQKIRLGFWLLALVPLGLGYLAVRNASELADASSNVAISNDIGKATEHLFSEIKDVELAQREYILLGGEQPLQTIRESHAHIDQDIRALRKLGADPRWMDLLEALLPQKFEEIQKTIDLRNQAGPEAASRELLANRGHAAMEDIRRVVLNMRVEQERRLNERSRDQAQRFVGTLRLFAFVLLLNGVLIVILHFLHRREYERNRKTNEELERRVALRTEALERSNEDLQQFAYIASHDMKEPLRMIGSYSALLQRRYAGRFDEDADTFINYIVDGARRMNNLIQDLLEYSQAGAGKDDQLSPISVESVLRNVIANLKVTIAESGATVRWDSLPETVPYDEIRLTQVFQNLVANAIKYRGDKRPLVRIRSDERDGEFVFSVRDNGIGIEPEHVDKIFGIFQRLHGKQYEGTGIGLAMVKKIVERYGGRIWVLSTPGEGSVFYFTVLKTIPVPVAEVTTTTTS